MKVKKILILSLLAINFNIFSLDPLLSKIIQKSRPDLLTKWLKHKGLSSKDRKLCIKIATEVCHQRKLKVDIICITSKGNKKTPYAGGIWLLTSIVSGYIGLWALGSENNGLNGPASAIISSIAFFSAFKMFRKSRKLDQEQLKMFRSKKEKYLDSIEVKHLLED